MKSLPWLYSFLFICLACFSGCSSSSSSDDTDEGGNSMVLSLPDTLAYTVSDPWYPDEYPGNDLLGADTGDMTISLIGHPDSTPGNPMRGTHMEGTYLTDTEETELYGGSSMWIDTGDLYGVMGLSVPDGVTVEWTGTDDPTSGSFLIDYRGDEMEDYNWILVEVIEDADGSGNDGVALSALLDMGSDPGATSSFTWEAFEDLDENGTEAYQRIASLCYGVWETVFERVGNCFNATALFIEFSDELYAQGENTVVQVSAGDEFPPGTGERGTVQCSWTDSSADDNMGPGDDFTLTLDNLWEDDEDDIIDEMFNGTVHLYGLLLETDDDRGIITDIGGDFVFENLTIRETVDNVIDEESAVTFNGGFNVSAYEY